MNNETYTSFGVGGGGMLMLYATYGRVVKCLHELQEEYEGVGGMSM